MKLFYADDVITELPVTFQFTTYADHADLLQQYFQLRQEVFTEYWNLKNYSGEEDHYDRIGDILIAMQGECCVGGMRLITRQAYSSLLLPMESPHFRLIHLLPHLQLDKEIYGEIGRAALLPLFRDGNYTRVMYQKTAEKSKELQHKYLFAVAPMMHARKIRIANHAIGLHTEICNDIIVPSSPSHEGIEMKLIIINIGDWLG